MLIQTIICRLSFLKKIQIHILLTTFPLLYDSVNFIDDFFRRHTFSSSSDLIMMLRIFLEALPHLDHTDIPSGKIPIFLKCFTCFLSRSYDLTTQRIPRNRSSRINRTSYNYDIKSYSFVFIELVQIRIYWVSGCHFKAVLTKRFQKFTPRLFVTVMICERENTVFLEGLIYDIQCFSHLVFKIISGLIKMWISYDRFGSRSLIPIKSGINIFQKDLLPDIKIISNLRVDYIIIVRRISDNSIKFRFSSNITHIILIYLGVQTYRLREFFCFESFSIFPISFSGGTSIFDTVLYHIPHCGERSCPEFSTPNIILHGKLGGDKRVFIK
ncbi:hypothetical protein C445_16924 [Halobiforma lacisalsi AJ5]|uniref:Uncharacterized protein n=1 Tax=Natronobacterium lacisalsi AJ5 TaxID=358396 RepID=M0LC65_NATLA|nr:hypothetical protein C445_16924 [Halobiforma lacisalsi AJ5]